MPLADHLSPSETADHRATATYDGDHPGGTLALTEHRLLYVADDEALVDCDRAAVTEAEHSPPSISIEFALPAFLALVASILLWIPYPQYAMLAVLVGPAMLGFGYVLRRRGLAVVVDDEQYRFSSRSADLDAIAAALGAPGAGDA